MCVFGKSLIMVTIQKKKKIFKYGFAYFCDKIVKLYIKKIDYLVGFVIFCFTFVYKIPT